MRLNHLLLGLGLMAIIAGALLIFLISDTVTRPLASLVKGVHALERGDMEYPLEASGHDELSELTRAFDGMRGTLRRNEKQRGHLEGQLRQAQKMEALGRMAGGVAHDFNNLLTVIRGHSDLLLDRLQPDEPLYRSCQQIRKTSDRAAALTRQMLAFSRMQVLQPKVLDLNELIADMGKLLRRLVREDIEFSLRLGDSLGRIKADPNQLEQVLLNLTVNASDAMPLGGRLTIETQNLFVDDKNAPLHPSVERGDYVVIAVSDSGHGMDAATRPASSNPSLPRKNPARAPASASPPSTASSSRVAGSSTSIPVLVTERASKSTCLKLSSSSTQHPIFPNSGIPSSPARLFWSWKTSAKSVNLLANS